MGVKRAEELLLNAALNYASGQQFGKMNLIRAALEYAKFKRRAADARDKWKLKKRMI